MPSSNFAAFPNTTIGVLADDGNVPEINHGNVLAATKANLETAIQGIGAQMSAGEQFIFVTSDHGAKGEFDVNQLALPGVSSGVTIELDTPFYQSILLAPDNTPTVEFVVDPLNLDLLNPLDLSIKFNDFALGTLGDAEFEFVDFGDWDYRGHYVFEVDDGMFTFSGTENIEIDNLGFTTLFLTAGIGTGAIPVAQVPEPSSFVLLGVGVAVLVCMRRRRATA